MEPHGAADVTMVYSDSKVLVKNWYEQRFQQDAASTCGSTLRDLPTGQRVLARDQRDPTAGFLTTKQQMDRSMLAAPAPAKVKKPCMISEATLAERLQAYGRPESVAFTLAEAARPVEHHLETTNQAVYDRLPKEATLRDPGQFSGRDTTFARTGALEQEARAVPTLCDSGAHAGGKGARGELTRRPGEAGNVYGVSVFVDEYAKWGSALKGMPLAESTAKMQSKYF